jgi:hypothetical protein
MTEILLIQNYNNKNREICKSSENSESSNEYIHKKRGPVSKYKTEDDKKKATYESKKKYNEKVSYYKQEHVKERQKLLYKRYRLKEQITKIINDQYVKKPKYSIDELQGKIVEINKLLEEMNIIKKLQLSIKEYSDKKEEIEKIKLENISHMEIFKKITKIEDRSPTITFTDKEIKQLIKLANEKNLTKIELKRIDELEDWLSFKNTAGDAIEYL